MSSLTPVLYKELARENSSKTIIVNEYLLTKTNIHSYFYIRRSHTPCICYWCKFLTSVNNETLE